MTPIPICTTRPTAQPSTLKLHGSARIARHTYSPKSSSVACCQLSVRNLMSCPSSLAARRANSSFELAASDPASGSTCLAPAAFSASSLRRRICSILPCSQHARELAKYEPFWIVGTVARRRAYKPPQLCGTLHASDIGCPHRSVAARTHASCRSYARRRHARGGGVGSRVARVDCWSWSKNTSDIMGVVPGMRWARRAVIRSLAAPADAAGPPEVQAPTPMPLAAMFGVGSGRAGDVGRASPTAAGARLATPR